ncbi:MAG: transcriptional regulator [Euryarchaeota archaeon]|nr:transcriptional regulator [Euryarchaeota archaeon]
MDNDNMLMMTMDSAEEEMVDLLRKLEVSKPAAKALVCLHHADEITSREIEMKSRLRQPEVSIAMRYLGSEKGMGWVGIRQVKMEEGKGRPTKVYRLTVPMEDIIDHLEQQLLSKNERVLSDIERLKSLS